LLHRLQLLKNTTKAFGAGQLESRVQTTGVTYIQDIEKDFNSMADQIQQLIEDNKLLTSAVSHDLRTPLARLRFGIDTLAETTSPDARAHYFKRVSSDLNEMEALVNSLLRYARLDNVMAGVEKQSINVRDLVGECVSQHYDSPLSIVIDDTQLADENALTVNGCIEHLATLFNNLIQNAVRFADRQIIIELQQHADSVVVTISDDGPGIPQELREHVMKPFERGSTEAKEGYGLGLAVAARIAKYHDGHINIDKCDRLGGALISVRLAQ
jgi:signal transduction histidine kinase